MAIKIMLKVLLKMIDHNNIEVHRKGNYIDYFSRTYIRGLECI